jgi:hypothetical protein
MNEQYNSEPIIAEDKNNSVINLPIFKSLKEKIPDSNRMSLLFSNLRKDVSQGFKKSKSFDIQKENQTIDTPLNLDTRIGPM